MKELLKEDWDPALDDLTFEDELAQFDVPYEAKVSEFPELYDDLEYDAAAEPYFEEWLGEAIFQVKAPDGKVGQVNDPIKGLSYMANKPGCEMLLLKEGKYRISERAVGLGGVFQMMRNSNGDYTKFGEPFSGNDPEALQRATGFISRGMGKIVSLDTRNGMKESMLQEGGKRKNMSQETINKFIHELLLIPDATRRQEVVDEIFAAIKEKNTEQYYKEHPEAKPAEPIKEGKVLDAIHNNLPKGIRPYPTMGQQIGKTLFGGEIFDDLIDDMKQPENKGILTDPKRKHDPIVRYKPQGSEAYVNAYNRYRDDIDAQKAAEKQAVKDRNKRWEEGKPEFKDKVARFFGQDEDDWREMDKDSTHHYRNIQKVVKRPGKFFGTGGLYDDVINEWADKEAKEDIQPELFESIYRKR